MFSNLRFSSTELSRVAAAIEVCARPLDSADLAQWRRDLLNCVMALLEAPIGHCDLVGFGLPQARLTRGYDGIFEEYESEFLHLDPSYELMDRLRMTTYTRRYRHRLAGELWTSRYRRSIVFQEFYSKHGLIDGAGILLRHGDRTALVHVETHGPGGDLFDERGRSLLLLLEPTFTAAIRVLQEASWHEWQAERLLDATAKPFALLDARGRYVHQTAALTAQVALLPAQLRAEVLETGRELARRVLRRPAGSGGGDASVSSAQPVAQCGPLRLFAVALGPDGPLARAYVLLRVETRFGSALDTPRVRRAGLTPRELEVVQLLARGMTDRAIAETLHVSWHTARRHTERVLRKLGVGSRHDVADALAPFPGDRNPGQ